MSLNDLTDPDAVRAAISEFDSLGREVFLRTYGFRPARDYFLVTSNGLYDSKPIVAAAHAFQYPDRGPLRAAKFSGGEETVAKRLRALGFEVTTGQTWAFCANPKYYKIREAIAHLEVDSWAVGRKNVKRGNRVVIWQTLDSSGQRGVVGFAEVLANPELRTDEANPYFVGTEIANKKERRVWVRYLPSSGLPIWIDDPKHGALLQDLSVAKARGGTVFKVSADQWRQLLQIASYRDAPEILEIEREISARPNRFRGQGFGLTSAERRVVEKHAMELAQRHLRQDWESVVDVSASSSFDLHCRHGSAELRVEVKGTTGLAGEIVLTRNEVREASEPRYALFVVSGIELLRKRDHAVKASGGVCRFFSPWSPKPDWLSPIA